MACLAAAGTLNLVKAKAKSVPFVSVGFALAPPVKPDQPRNILLIGTDSAARLDANDPVKNGRDDFGLLADVIMVLRIDPSKGTAALLSIPRDTWVPTAPFGKKEKINAAINGSRGAENLIATVKENFGISIQNYAQVDFRGFRDLVDVLGGVPVYLNMPIRDQNTGLLQEGHGCVTLDKVQALAYARSRHFEYFDGKRWKSDPTGDLGRITRQQDFLKSAAQRAASKGIRNPATAFNLVDAAVGAVTLDATLSAGQILDILDLFRSFNLDTLKTYQIPTTSVRRGDADTQDVEWDAALPMLKIFWNEVDGQAPVPSDVLVEVSGGSNPTGVVANLEQIGFDADPASTVDGSAQSSGASGSGASGNSGTAASPTGGSATVISYGPRGKDAANLLARYFDGPVRLTADASLPGRRLTVQVGRNVAAARTTPLDPSQVQLSADSPGTSSKNRTTSTTTSTTTTTTVPSTGGSSVGSPTTTAPAYEPGILPVDPTKAASCS